MKTSIFFCSVQWCLVCSLAPIWAILTSTEEPNKVIAVLLSGYAASPTSTPTKFGTTCGHSSNLRWSEHCCFFGKHANLYIRYLTKTFSSCSIVSTIRPTLSILVERFRLPSILNQLAMMTRYVVSCVLEIGPECWAFYVGLWLC